MTHADAAIAAARDDGAFAAIARLAVVGDIEVAAEAYNEALKTAYWQERDIHLVTALGYAGASRLLAYAEGADADAAFVARSLAKTLVYNVASFTWPGWGEPDVEIAPSDQAAGLAAARANLAMAQSLDKGPLAESRARWMLGAHLLTSGSFEAAQHAFVEAAVDAAEADALDEEALASAFVALAALAAGTGTVEALEDRVDALRAFEHGDSLAEQVTTAKAVIGA